MFSLPRICERHFRSRGNVIANEMDLFEMGREDDCDGRSEHRIGTSSHAQTGALKYLRRTGVSPFNNKLRISKQLTYRLLSRQQLIRTGVYAGNFNCKCYDRCK